MIGNLIRRLARLRELLETDQKICSGEWIEINDLEVSGRIGVPEMERQTPQRMLVCLRFQIQTSFALLNDQLEKTVDYGEVAAEVEKVVRITESHLIEKLVSEIGMAQIRFGPKRSTRSPLR